MSGLLPLLDFAGYVALLLWGVHMVQTGVQRAFGAALSIALGRALGTRLRAFASGLGITAALQSSTATGLMITGFAAGGWWRWCRRWPPCWAPTSAPPSSCSCCRST